MKKCESESERENEFGFFLRILELYVRLEGAYMSVRRERKRVGMK